MTVDQAISALKKVSTMAEVTSITISVEGHEFVYSVDDQKWRYWEDEDETVDDAEMDSDDCTCGPGEFCVKCTPTPGKDVGA